MTDSNKAIQDPGRPIVKKRPEKDNPFLNPDLAFNPNFSQDANKQFLANYDPKLIVKQKEINKKIDNNNIVHTPPYIVNSSGDSTNGYHGLLKTATIINLNDNKYKNLLFRKSKYNDIRYILHDILIPNYFKYLNEYKYIYNTINNKINKSKSRFHAISTKYTKYINEIINQPIKYNYFYVLYNNNSNRLYGHILLSPPQPKNSNYKGSKSPNKYQISRIIYWQIPIKHGIQSFWRKYKYDKCIKYINNELMKYCHRYWLLELIAIDDKLIANGYGTYMLNETHKYIQNKSVEDSNRKVPIIVITCTEKSVNFYLKLGYQIFMKVIIDKNEDIIAYGMLYHWNNNIKKQWIAVLKDNVSNETKFSIYKFIFEDKTFIGWIRFVLFIPVLLLYLFICLLLRFVGCGY